MKPNQVKSKTNKHGSLHLWYSRGMQRRLPHMLPRARCARWREQKDILKMLVHTRAGGDSHKVQMREEGDPAI